MPHRRSRFDHSSGYSSLSDSSAGSDTDEDGPQPRRWTEYNPGRLPVRPGRGYEEDPDAILPASRRPGDIEMHPLPTISEDRAPTGHHSAAVPIKRGGYSSGPIRDPAQQARREAAQKAKEERAARERAELHKHKWQLFSVSAARDVTHMLWSSLHGCVHPVLGSGSRDCKNAGKASLLLELIFFVFLPCGSL